MVTSLPMIVLRIDPRNNETPVKMPNPTAIMLGAKEVSAEVSKITTSSRSRCARVLLLHIVTSINKLREKFCFGADQQVVAAAEYTSQRYGSQRLNASMKVKCQCGKDWNLNFLSPTKELNGFNLSFPELRANFLSPARTTEDGKCKGMDFESKSFLNCVN